MSALPPKADIADAMRKCPLCANNEHDHHAFEFIDLIVTSMPLPRAGKPLYPFNQNAPVPRAIENYDLAGVREPFPEALQVVPAAFVRQRRRDRIYLKASRV